MTTDKRESIIKKISLLKEKTTQNGCTESEAMAAADMISKLLYEYDLSMTDVEVRNQDFLTDSIIVNGKRKKPIHDIVYYISYFTDTKTYRAKKFDRAEYMFFGAKKDVEFANYLFHLLSNSMDYEYSKFQKTKDYENVHGRTLRTSFYSGMAHRLSQRLRDMKDAIKKESEESGLMLYDKMSITLEMFNKLNPDLRLKNARNTLRVTNLKAFNSGQLAANNVNINKGVSGSSTSEQLRLKA